MPRIALTTLKGMGCWKHTTLEAAQVCEHLGGGDFGFPKCYDKCKYRVWEGSTEKENLSWNVKKNDLGRKHSIWAWKHEYTVTKQKRKVVARRGADLCQISRTPENKVKTKARCSTDITEQTGEEGRGSQQSSPRRGSRQALCTALPRKGSWVGPGGVQCLVHDRRVVTSLSHPETAQVSDAPPPAIVWISPHWKFLGGSRQAPTRS